MKPYISFFKEDTNEGHSSMSRRGKNTYVSVYEQNFNSCFSSKKNMNRNMGNDKNAKTAIPPEYFSIKESEDKISKPNTIQPIFIFNIINGDDAGKTISAIIRSLS